ncbi:MAG TPA: helix-turn-helix domain-containing protein [Pirellulales bacterium]|nr:helix-turn-helix domain-containing protein [Pirellulales bacterium]
MTSKRSNGLSGKTRGVYLDLVRRFPLTSIKSEAELRAAQAVIDGLFRQGALNRGAEVYLDALSDLVASYEDEHHAIEPASDADMLRHLMESKGVTQADLSRATGIAKSAISEVLRGKKPFSRRMMRQLADYFRVDVGILAMNV